MCKFSARACTNALTYACVNEYVYAYGCGCACVCVCLWTQSMCTYLRMRVYTSTRTLRTCLCVWGNACGPFTQQVMWAFPAGYAWRLEATWSSTTRPLSAKGFSLHALKSTCRPLLSSTSSQGDACGRTHIQNTRGMGGCNS